MKEEKVKEIMKLTCFDSIAYCCGLEKRCALKDTVLILLGISPEEYIRWKEEFTQEIISIILARKGGE